MGLFDKKSCDLCREKIGLMGNRKLANGNMCKDCLKLASPYLAGRNTFTVADIKEHLEYREQNKQTVATFNPTSTYGTATKIYIDETQGLWLVSASRNYRNENPDVMATNQVTGCMVTVDEIRTELKFKDSSGAMKRYNPPKYDIDYDIYVTINVNNPWYSEIKFKANSTRIKERHSAEFKSAENEANAIRQALTQVRETIRQTAAEAAKPKTSVTCPHCHAGTIPDEHGRCEYCNGAV